MRLLYVLILAFLLLIALSPYVACETIMLKAGQSRTISGKNLTLLASYSEFITVNVDGVQRDINVFLVQNATEIRFNSLTVNVNGVNITVNDVFESQKMAELIIQVGFVCGDDVCSSAETSTICCKDCGCSSAYTCIDNQCIESRLNQCSNASECNDNNPCTADLCQGIPRKCSNILVSVCIDNDECCPEKCYYENDSDCPRNKTKFECFSSRECTDSNVCTLDYCEEGKCKHDKEDGCDFNNTCMPIGSRQIISNVASYCVTAGWQKQKKSSQDCIENFECLSNACEQGKCKGAEEKKIVKGKNNIMLCLSIAAILLLVIIIYLFFKLKKK